MSNPTVRVAVSPPPVRSGRILLAEDNPVNQNVARLQISRLGFHVVTVADGQQALELYRQSPAAFDCILMDNQMPVLDGMSATRAIRAWEQADGQGRHVTIIAMTADAMAGDREACLAAGMDDYLSKPVKREALEHALKAVATASAD